MAWVNTRLPASQTQFCIRKYLEGGIDDIHLEKGAKADPALLKNLGLVRKAKPEIAGRRAVDLEGLFQENGREVELVSFSAGAKRLEAVAFFKDGAEKSRIQIAAWSEGSPEAFLKKYNPLGAGELLTTK